MRTILLIASSLLVLSACGGKQNTGSSEPTTMPTEEAVVEMASVRVIHASTATPIRVTSADGAIATDAVGTGTWTDRMDVPAGAYELTFGPSGGGEAFATADATFAPDAAYSLILVGDHTSVIRASMPRVLVVEDDLSAPAEGEARVRFVHAAVGASPVTLSNGEGRGYATGLAYGDVSGWYSVAGGSQTLDVAADGAIVASIPAPFTAGFDTTVVLTAGGGGITAAFVHDTAN